MPLLNLHFATEHGLLLLRPDVPLPGFTAAFSTRVELRAQGPRFCNYGFSGRPGARTTRDKLMRALALNRNMLTAAWQEHTAHVALVDRDTAGCGGFSAATRIPDTDALATRVPGAALAVMTADCVPILLADPGAAAAAAIHAGWRGSAQGIIAQTVQALRSSYNSRPRHIIALIGPHICAHCYEVGPDVAKHVSDHSALTPAGHKYFLNLARWNSTLLRETGVLKKNIYVTHYCTSCRTDLFYSYRADKKNRGSNASLIAITG